MSSYPYDPQTDEYTSTPKVPKFYLFHPRVEDVHIEDIAYLTSRTRRFNGNTRGEPLSVAEHLCNVKRIVAEWFPEDYDLQLAAHLHDGAEGYVGDLIQPIKYKLPEYRRIEDEILRVIFQALDIPWPSNKGWASIKEADDIMMVTERNAVVNYHGLQWEIDKAKHAIPRSDIPIECWTWVDAEYNFLYQYELLKLKCDESKKTKSSIRERCAA